MVTPSDVVISNKDRSALPNETDDEDTEDESLKERLVGLTEMFPDCLQRAGRRTVSLVKSGTVGLFHLSRSALWIIASSATILVLPVMFEHERAQLAEQELQHNRQILLGPSAGISPGSSLLPNMHPPGMMPAAPMK